MVSDIAFEIDRAAVMITTSTIKIHETLNSEAVSEARDLMVELNKYRTMRDAEENTG
jgi:hypothetical protein